MTNKIIEASKRELELASKTAPTARLNNLVLVAGDEENPLFKCSYEGKKIEGEYVTTVNGQDLTVTVEQAEGNVFVSGLIADSKAISSLALYKDNTALRRAVINGLESVKEISLDDSLFVIGPAGTGKTQVISTIAPAMVAAGLRVLIIAHANKAVENAIERAAGKLAHLADGDVVVSCATTNESLKKLSPKAIASRKMKPLQLEVSILEAGLMEAASVISQKEPLLNALESEDDVMSTIIANLTRERNNLKNALKALQEEKIESERVLEKLSAETLFSTLANAFTGKAREAQKQTQQAEIEAISKKIVEVEASVAQVEQRIADLAANASLKNADLLALRQEVAQAKAAKKEMEASITNLREQISKAALMDVFSTAKLVGATLYSAALSPKINDFDVVICDEASMADAAALLLVCSKIKSAKLPEVAVPNLEGLNDAQAEAVKRALKTSLIFVGDPKQLSTIAKTADARKSLFEYFGVSKMFDGERVENAVMLNINYRNHPDIVSAASKLYYGGMLKSGREANGKKALFIRKCLSPSHTEDGSYVNLGSAQACVDQVAAALKRGQRSIGVISPFKKQAEKIDAMLEPLRKEYSDAELTAGTVHTFQGKEMSVVLFDLTHQPKQKLLPTFVGDETSECARLANVAFTRAKDFFVVIGDVEAYKKQASQLGLAGSAILNWISEIEAMAYAA